MCEPTDVPYVDRILRLAVPVSTMTSTPVYPAVTTSVCSATIAAVYYEVSKVLDIDAAYVIYHDNAYSPQHVYTRDYSERVSVDSPFVRAVAFSAS